MFVAYIAITNMTLRVNMPSDTTARLINSATGFTLLYTATYSSSTNVIIFSPPVIIPKEGQSVASLHT